MVRATANEANFLRGFLAGDIQLLAGGAIIDTQGFAITASAALQGAGGLTKVGSGTLTLSGVSTYGGQTTVEGGRLIVNGSIANSAVTVLSGAALGGSGTVGLTTIRSGATISPGNSIGSLSVNGNLVLAPGSTYAAEIAGDGSSDRIAVSGSAMVGGSRLSITALDPATSYVNGQRYTVLTAAAGVSGIASAVSQSAFLDVALEHEPNEIDLVVKIKNNAPGPSAGSGSGSSPTAPPAIFGTVAQTRNQLAAAGALDTLPQAGRALTLYNGLLMLDAPSARDAFTALSGEAHASARTVLIEDSRLLRGAMNDRLRSAFGSVNAAPMATMSYGFSADHAPSLTGPMPALSTERFAVWGQGHGAWGRTGGDGNAAKLTRRTGGFLIGADASVFDTLRIGVVAGYDRSTFDARSRFSSGESDNYHLGLYAGGRWGAFGLRAGASYTWHDIETSRRVAFTGFSDGLKGDYTAGTAQLFGEAGHRVDLGRVALEPFAGLAYVNLRAGGFRETGGAAALSARSDDTGVGYATLGLRASTSFELAGAATTLRGGLAWRHAFGDVDPKATLAFSGSSSFAVAGIPIARDAAVVEAGLDLALGHSAKLGLSYAGQLAAEAQDHSFKGMLSVMF
jgi:outer membrane autotransporter protein